MDLEHLNQLMFEAESQQDVEGVPWEKFLTDTLADDFVLRRSAAAKPPENRAAFLSATREAVPAARTVVGTRKWLSDSIGVVTSVVEVAGRPEQFTNTRVFTKGGFVGGWHPMAGGGRKWLGCWVSASRPTRLSQCVSRRLGTDWVRARTRSMPLSPRRAARQPRPAQTGRVAGRCSSPQRAGRPGDPRS